MREVVSSGRALERFRLDPERFHLVERCLAEGAAIAPQLRLDVARSGAMNLALVRRSAVSGSTERCRARLATAKRMSPSSSSSRSWSCVAGESSLSNSADLLADLGDHRAADRSSRSRRCRRASAASRRGSSAGRAIGTSSRMLSGSAASPAAARRAARSAFSSALISSQRSFTAAASLRIDVAEDMRVAADQLVVIASTTSPKAKRAFLLRHLRVEDDLQQEVAELILQVVEIAALDRVGDLVGFLDRVGRDRREILLRGPTGSRSPASAAAP